MKTDTTQIDKQQLAQMINAAYGLALMSLVFVPKGEDAFIYIGHTAESKRYFVRAQPTERADDLEHVYARTYELHGQHGAAQIIVPFRTHQHRFTIAYGPFTVAVFPYVEGRTLYQDPSTPDDVQQVARALAQLHDLPVAMLGLQRERFDNPFAAPIRRALETAHADDPTRTALQHATCRLLHVERADIEATLAHMERLQAACSQVVADWVLTHGDPNSDNMLKDGADRLYVTDWGALAVGPPERDLFHWTGDTWAVFLAEYVGVRPQVALHRPLFEFYAYRWSMQEIADYATRLLFGGRGAIEDEHAWAELQDYLPVRHTVLRRTVDDVMAAISRAR